MRDIYSLKYIRGKGIEIGGNYFPVGVPEGTEVTYVDLAPWPNDAEAVKKNLVVDDAEKLEHFKMDSRILSSPIMF